MKPPPAPTRTTAIAFPPRSSAMLSGCTMCSASACGMLSCSWLNAVSSSPMRPFGAGARNSAKALLPRAPPTAATGRQVAHGRGVHPDPGRAALSVARRGSGWRCARRPRSGTPRCHGRQAILQAPAERSAICAASDRDRQTEKLRRGEAPPASRRRASPKPISEQSCRELTSADTAPRTADATVQIARAGPGLPLRSRVHPWPLPSTPPSPGRRYISCKQVRGIWCLAPGDVRPIRDMIRAGEPPWAPARPSRVNVTMPCGQLLLQHRLDEAPDTAPQIRFDRVEPSLAGKQRLGSARGRDILVHGVVSCRRANAGLGLFSSTGDYATPIPTTSATAPIERSKTDTDGEGAEIALPRGRSDETCPVSALQAWLVVAEITAGPLFRKVNRGGVVETARLSPDAVRQILLKRAARAGLKGTLAEPVSPHGLRAGFVTTACLPQRCPG